MDFTGALNGAVPTPCPATLPQCSNTRVTPEYHNAEVGILRVLLVEDEPEMAAALIVALKSYDMVVDHISTLADAEEAASVNDYGAILLDRQLPDGDGLTLIPKLRAKGAGVPVIVLTARGELADRIAGLDAGADDYLAKPFAVEELLARLRAVLRRPDGNRHLHRDTDDPEACLQGARYDGGRGATHRYPSARHAAVGRSHS